MITAQWATGKSGGRYRYYRCTKKNGKCSQKYVQEISLAEQVKDELQGVSLPEAWADYMLKKVEEFEHEETHASGTRLGEWKEDLKTLEAKLDTLVDLYLNKDIEREAYLAKKDTLMRQKLSLQAKSASLRAEQKNWVEPLRQWILDSKQAGFLATSTKYAEMRDFVRSFGTNPALRDKTISLSFCPPSIFAKTRKLEFLSKHHTTAQPSAGFLLSPAEVSECDPTESRTPLPTLRRLCPNR